MPVGLIEEGRGGWRDGEGRHVVRWCVRWSMTPARVRLVAECGLPRIWLLCGFIFLGVELFIVADNSYCCRLVRVERPW